MDCGRPPLNGLRNTAHGPIIVLGIEASCDETAVAILWNGGEILANLVYSQTDLHARYGGVMPRGASRDHLWKLPELLDEALAPLGWGRVGRDYARGGGP